MIKNTEWLSVTENLIYCTGQKTHYNDYKLLLNTVQVQEQVTPKMITGNSFAPSFLEPPHTFLQYRA